MLLIILKRIEIKCIDHENRAMHPTMAWNTNELFCYFISMYGIDVYRQQLFPFLFAEWNIASSISFWWCMIYLQRNMTLMWSCNRSRSIHTFARYPQFNMWTAIISTLFPIIFQFHIYQLFFTILRSGCNTKQYYYFEHALT